jgi:hypothetical protein
MIKPLSLGSPQPEPNGDTNELCSPASRHRADSLVFSVTSQKYYSPKETMLIDSHQQDVSRELETLQLKLEHLENRVERIDSEQGQDNPFEKPRAKRFEPSLRIDLDKESFIAANENRHPNFGKAGKIVKKERDLSRTTKIERSEGRKPRVQTFVTHQSRQSRNSLIS